MAALFFVYYCTQKSHKIHSFILSVQPIPFANSQIRDKHPYESFVVTPKKSIRFIRTIRFQHHHEDFVSSKTRDFTNIVSR